MKRTRQSLLTAAAAVSALGLLAGCGSAGNSAASSSVSEPASTTAETVTTVDAATPVLDGCDAGELLASLSTRDKLAQMVTVGVTGTADATAIVADQHVGGIFITGSTDNEVLQGGVAQVNDAWDIAPLVSIDEEGGRVARIPNLIGPTPAARDVSRSMTVEQARQEALDRGTQLHDMGVTVDFAPDVDVSAQPDDAVIGDRSYSDDPNVVTDYATAFADGMREAGVFPVLKHFPGHGSSSGDSHLGAVTVPPLEELQDKDLVPFRNMVGNGVAVMVGHLDVPGLTEPDIPTSVSPATMQLLRDGVGYGAAPFDGVIFTDDLSGMAAITDRYTLPQSVVAALSAGADVALWGSTDRVSEVLDALEAAVASGELPIEQVDASAIRILTLKSAANCPS